MRRARRPPSAHRRRRAVSPIIATVLLVGITIVAGTLLWAFRPPVPPAPPSLTYVGLGQQSEPAWGDPTDCTNTSIYATCNVLPAVFVVVTSHAPVNLNLAQIEFLFRCNGTILLSGSLQALEVVPGTGSSPGASSPTLGNCGTWTPNSYGFGATYFNRLGYFQQVQRGATTLTNGDQLVIYVHPAGDFKDMSRHAPDDDYHGAPPWCFTVASACQIYLTYGTNPASLLATIPVSSVAVV